MPCCWTSTRIYALARLQLLLPWTTLHAECYELVGSHESILTKKQTYSCSLPLNLSGGMQILSQYVQDLHQGTTAAPDMPGYPCASMPCCWISLHIYALLLDILVHLCHAAGLPQASTPCMDIPGHLRPVVRLPHTSTPCLDIPTQQCPAWTSRHAWTSPCTCCWISPLVLLALTSAHFYALTQTS